MGGQVSRSDFMWVYTQQPHVARRKIILGELCNRLVTYEQFDLSVPVFFFHLFCVTAVMRTLLIYRGQGYPFKLRSQFHDYSRWFCKLGLFCKPLQFVTK